MKSLVAPNTDVQDLLENIRSKNLFTGISSDTKLDTFVLFDDDNQPLKNEYVFTKNDENKTFFLQIVESNQTPVGHSVTLEPNQNKQLLLLQQQITDLQLELKKETEQLHQKTQALTEQVAYLSLSGFQSISHIAVYEHIESHSGFIQDINEVFKCIPHVEPSLIKHLWDGCAVLAPPGTATEDVYQSSIETIFSKCISTHLQLHKKKHLLSPDKQPDLSITSSYDASLAWKNLLVPVEVETKDKHKEGLGQAISYLAIALRESRRPTGFCVFTDCHTIDIIRIQVDLTKGIPIVHHTGCIPFLLTSKNDIPSQGFSLLVKLLQSNPSQLGANIKHPTGEELGISHIAITKFMAFGTTSQVYGGLLDTESVAVKIEQPGNATLPHEVTVLQYLNANAPAFPYFPQIVHSSPSILITTPLGMSLQHKVMENERFSIQQAMTYMSHIIEALHKAHSLNWYHHDIRPSNIILVKILNDNNNQPINEQYRAVLIDWGNAVRFSDNDETFHGTLAYASDSILRAFNRHASYRYERKHEFESLAYTLLFMLLGALPWHKAQSGVAILTARKHVEQQEFVGKKEYSEFLSMVNSKSSAEKLLQFCQKCCKEDN